MARAWDRILALLGLALGPGCFAATCFATGAPPEALPGCAAAREERGLDPEGTVWTYDCAFGVRARVWTRPGGWPDAEAAFAEAFARMPEIDRHWKILADRYQWPADLVGKQAADVKYRSFRGGLKTWVVPAGARPRLLLETNCEVGDRNARAEAERAMSALIARVRGAP